MGPSRHEAAGWELEGEEREAFVRGMFDRIAGPYDRLNRVISLGRDRAWRRRVVALAEVRRGARAVDLGTGTGDLAFELAAAVAPEGSVTGVDIAEGMLRNAESKREALGVACVEFRRGSAAACGEPDASADAVTMGWVLRNVADRAAVYREVLRVLVPGGRFVCIDMSRPLRLASRTGFWCYRHALMPLLARCAGGDVRAYRYLAGSTDHFPDAPALAAELRAAGFSGVTHESLMMGSLAIHRGVRP